MSDVSDWWSTAIIDMEPGRIAFRGHPVQDLIGNVSFPQMIWLLLRGDLPTEGQARLLEAALHLVEIRVAKLAPFGGDGQRVGAI